MSDINDVINVSSVYGASTHEPLVEVKWGNKSGVLDLDSARQLGRDLIEAAAASETDAFLMDYFEKKVGITDLGARASVIADFRQWRKELGFTK